MDCVRLGVLMNKLPGNRVFCFDDKTLKISFYIALAFVLIVALMALLAITYAGSIDPLDFLRYKNFTFAYAGTPNYAQLYSDNLSVGLSSINGTTVSLTVSGASTMTLYPAGDLLLKSGSKNYTTTVASPLIVRTPDGKNTTVIIKVAGEDGFSHDMNFSFRNEVSPAQDDSSRTDNWIKLMKKGQNLYTLVNSSFSRGPKQFTVKPNSKCTHTISIQGVDLPVNGIPQDRADRIDYTGQLQVLTDADMVMRIPVSAMSGAGFYRLELTGADGHLDVTHNAYQCTPADSITAIYPAAGACNSPCPEYCSFLSLLNGNLEAHGYATELKFRERNFGYPYTVIIKEGHLALMVGALSSFLTFVFGRLLKQFKKK